MWVVSSLNDKYIYLWCLWYITRSESRYLTYDVHLIAFSFGLSVKERRHVELESLNNPHSSRCASDYSLVCLCYTISLDNWLSHWLSYGHGLINRTCNAATRANNYIRTFLTFTLYYIFGVLRVSCRDDHVVQLLFLALWHQRVITYRIVLW